MRAGYASLYALHYTPFSRELQELFAKFARFFCGTSSRNQLHTKRFLCNPKKVRQDFFPAARQKICSKKLFETSNCQKKSILSNGFLTVSKFQTAFFLHFRIGSRAMLSIDESVFECSVPLAFRDPLFEGFPSPSYTKHKKAVSFFQKPLDKSAKQAYNV